MLVMLMTFPLWLPWIGEYLVVSDPLEKADAIVILAGDENERITEGANLFHQGYGNWLILTDMKLNIPNSEGYYGNNVKRKAIDQGVPAEKILIIPGQVSTTDEEASTLKPFIRSKGFSSVIVITSPSHTRRAQIILNEVIGSDPLLIIHPSNEPKYDAHYWWLIQEDRNNTFLEYSKILAHFLGCRHYNSCGIPELMHIISWFRS